MKRIFPSIIMTITLLFTLTSCSSTSASDTVEPDYQKVKEITLDVLHTNEGKKIILDQMKDPSFKQEMIMKTQELEKIFTKSLTDQKTAKQWQKLLTNPETVKQYSKLTEDKQKQFLKALMKDPEYQKSMMDILKDPEYSKNILQLLKSQENRKETMKIMQELIKTPSFKKALKEGMPKEEGKASGEKKDKSKSQQ